MLAEVLWSPIVGSLIGVVLGFLLGAAGGSVRAALRIRRLHRALDAECRTMISHIARKKQIFAKAVDALRRGKLVPGRHVKAPTIVYDRHVSDLIPQLTDEERTVLHYAYERVRVCDEELGKQEDTISFLRNRGAENPEALVAGHLEALSPALDVAAGLFQSYLDRKPVDVVRLAGSETQVGA